MGKNTGQCDKWEKHWEYDKWGNMGVWQMRKREFDKGENVGV
tara:strand:+ start:320 stop:445 length:126 start_codon:yes stop_codon:yes gene_type:complete